MPRSNKYNLHHNQFNLSLHIDDIAKLESILGVTEINGRMVKQFLLSVVRNYE